MLPYQGSLVPPAPEIVPRWPCSPTALGPLGGPRPVTEEKRRRVSVFHRSCPRLARVRSPALRLRGRAAKNRSGSSWLLRGCGIAPQVVKRNTTEAPEHSLEGGLINSDSESGPLGGPRPPCWCNKGRGKKGRVDQTSDLYQIQNSDAFTNSPRAWAGGRAATAQDLLLESPMVIVHWPYLLWGP